MTGALIALFVKLLEALVEMGFRALWFRTEVLSPLRVFVTLKDRKPQPTSSRKCSRF
jgi:hypothetical protein